MSNDDSETREDLFEAIDSFLGRRRLSDGGYAPVLPVDLDELDSILKLLISLKWQEDPDGDVPIEFVIVNRHRFQRRGYLNLPYVHKVIPDGEFEGYTEAVIFNLEIAMRDVTLWDRERRYRREEKKGEKIKESERAGKKIWIKIIANEPPPGYPKELIVCTPVQSEAENIALDVGYGNDYCLEYYVPEPAE